MKKFFKNDIYLLIILIFIVLIFKNNILFKQTILSCCFIFFEQVFPTLLPMFIINDLLIEYHFTKYLNALLHPFFYKLFSFSNAATYTFIMSIFSGTPTNGYIVTKLVTEQNLCRKDASIILSYSFFLNPLFLYNMLQAILKDSYLTFKIIAITYSVNLIIAFYFRKYPYQNIELKNEDIIPNFAKALTSSIKHAFSVLTNILGTMIFYFILCEGINLFWKNALLNCLLNGFLEVTGGLAKLNQLNLNLLAKEFLALVFISFGGLSIHSQIKSIILDANISFKTFFKARVIHLILSTTILIITS